VFDERSLNANGRTNVVPGSSAVHVVESPVASVASTRLGPARSLPSIVTEAAPKLMVKRDAATVAGQSAKSGNVFSRCRAACGSSRGAASTERRSDVPSAV
jgi:hypothetical protein